jgi:hypothetical protein
MRIIKLLFIFISLLLLSFNLFGQTGLAISSVLLASSPMVLMFTMQITSNRRSRLIGNYTFHPALKSKLKEKHTNLTEHQIGLVFKALRDYFQICAKADGRMVSMPSQVVDDAWHDFILFTKDYEVFCKKAFGKYLHHTPAEAMASPSDASEGIKRAWRLACIKEKIMPGKAENMPLLFAIDALLAIPNGFTYQLKCAPESGSGGFCASDIGCSSGCAGGCGGGDGCGGGCGGGD